MGTFTRDLTNPKWMLAKAVLLLLVGLLAFGIALLRQTDLTEAAWLAGLWAVSVWGFCRAYYFAFYVIEHYIDGEAKYAGLIDFVRRLVLKAGAKENRN